MKKLAGESLNIMEENLSAMQQLFPEAFEEGKIDFAVLRQLLGDYVDDEEERYSFRWNGKGKALRLSQTPSTGTLRPCKEESKDWNTTENLYIEGDNLEVLKLLQKSYHGKVKMIYIDPPYNTGKDFVYKDDFCDNVANYKRITGQVDDEGNWKSANKEMRDSSGHFHTDWLNMMYPRLRLARNLLSDDGVIFISIDDNEQDNLKKICDEVFGEGNFVGCAGRITKKSNNKGDFWAPNLDYIVTYTKNREIAVGFTGGANESSYNLIENEGERKGEKYQLVRLYMSSLRNRNPEQRFWIECPDGSHIIPPGKTFPPHRPEWGDGIWRWTKKKFEENMDRIVIKKVKSSNLLNDNHEPACWNVYTKTYLSDVLANLSAKPNSLIEKHINQIASHELTDLDIPFDYAKPSTLVAYLMKVLQVGNNDIVMDFFSGSGTTAHAVMQRNLENNTRTKFIMIQIPEINESNTTKYENICEIGKERIRRAGEKIKAECEDAERAASLDIGFKVFKLDSSNLQKWQPQPEDLFASLQESMDNFLPGRTELDVVYEIALKLGLDLSYEVEEREVDGQTIYVIGAGALMICLASPISMETAEALIKLHEEYAPETWQVVFRDTGFLSDQEKTNIKETLKSAGLDEDAFISI